MKKEKATIEDFARMCNKNSAKCDECPLTLINNGKHEFCDDFIRQSPDKANEIILKWCKEHPIKTRQSELLKMFPNAPKDENGVIAILSCTVEAGYAIANCSKKSCTQCRKEYWLAEIDENEWGGAANE